MEHVPIAFTKLANKALWKMFRHTATQRELAQAEALNLDTTPPMDKEAA
jgi:hypothetical protein